MSRNDELRRQEARARREALSDRDADADRVARELGARTSVVEKQRRKLKRQLLRQLRLPKDHTCPTCGETVVESSRWAASGDVVECKSCRQARNASARPCANKLVELRRRRGLSCRKMAELCGWSYSTQRRIESGRDTDPWKLRKVMSYVTRRD